MISALWEDGPQGPSEEWSESAVGPPVVVRPRAGRLA